MNLSFGAVYADNSYYCEESETVISQMILWQPGQRMIDLDVNGSQQMVVATWKNWRQGAFSDEALKERIAGLEHQIKDSGAFAREDRRWPEGNQNEDFSFLSEFAVMRMQAVDAYMTELE